MFSKLYTAPAALGDFCDSSGCLPGQIPMPGQKPHSVLDKNADQTVEQVRSPSGQRHRLMLRRSRREAAGRRRRAPRAGACVCACSPAAVNDLARRRGLGRDVRACAEAPLPNGIGVGRAQPSVARAAALSSRSCCGGLAVGAGHAVSNVADGSRSRARACRRFLRWPGHARPSRPPPPSAHKQPLPGRWGKHALFTVYFGPARLKKRMTAAAALGPLVAPSLWASHSTEGRSCLARRRMVGRRSACDRG